MNGSPPVYVDVVFAVNLVMDFFLLWAVGRLTGIQTVFKRLFSASILGAIYSVGFIFVELTAWYDFPIKIIMSAILVTIAFWPSSGREFLKVWVYFYGVSFAMAGAVVGASFLFQNGSTASAHEFSYLWLGGGVACSIALGSYGDRLLREKILPELLRCPVELRFGSISCQGLGFIDTGNSLTDPLTNKPVVVAECELIRTFCPSDVSEVLAGTYQDGSLFEALAQTEWAHRLRLIPFTSIGSKHGLLVGIRSDEFSIKHGNGWVTHPGVVVGLYRESLCPDGSFQMLVPAAMVD